jgi:hypothetical protein
MVRINLVAQRRKTKASCKLRNISESLRAHFPRLFMWCAEWGWAGLLGFAVALEEAHEYLGALFFVVASAISLVAAMVYGKGIEDSHFLTIAGRISGSIFALILLVVGSVWVLGSKGSQSWSRLPSAWHVVFEEGQEGNNPTRDVQTAKSQDAPVAQEQPQSAQPTTSSRDSEEVQVGIVLGSDLNAAFPFTTTCATKGVSCLGEEDVDNQKLNTHLYGDGWSRIIVQVSFYGEEFDVTNLYTDISTPESGVGLNYQDQKEASPHNWIRFLETSPIPVTITKRPLTYPVDVSFGPAVKDVPIAVDVWGDNMKTHSIRTSLHIIR